MNRPGWINTLLCLPVLLWATLPIRGGEYCSPDDESNGAQNVAGTAFPDSSPALSKGSATADPESATGFQNAIGSAESAIARADRLANLADRAARTAVLGQGSPMALPASVTGVPTATAGDPDLDRLIDTYATRHNLVPDLVRALIQVESNFNPLAVSPKGAQGLMQLMPETARRYGVRDIFNPEENLSGGIRYLSDLLRMFNGNLPLTVSAYNAGENLVAKIQKIPDYPETREYVTRVAGIFDFRRSPYLRMP